LTVLIAVIGVPVISLAIFVMMFFYPLQLKAELEYRSQPIHTVKLKLDNLLIKRESRVQSKKLPISDWRRRKNEGREADPGRSVSRSPFFYKTARYVKRAFYKFIRKTIIIKYLAWQSALGLENAMDTSLGTGFLWAAQSNAVSILSAFFTLSEIKMDIKPVYGEAVLYSRIKCILKVRLVHIILINIIWKKGFLPFTKQ
jgi:hypothetical protein